MAEVQAPTEGLGDFWVQLWGRLCQAQQWQQRAVFGPHPPVGTTPHRALLQQGTWRVLRYENPGSSARSAMLPLLIVPSLINQFYILDLQPGRSLVEYLQAHGFQVYMLDWGTPGPEDRWAPFSAYAYERINAAVAAVQHDSSSPQLSILGYCMGGTLATIYSALAPPSTVVNLVNLAGPINFHDDGLLSLWTRPAWFNVDRLVDTLGNIPAALLQQTFLMLQPTAQVRAAVKLADYIERGQTQQLHDFWALHTWINDNVAFPGEAFRTYIKEFYQANRLVTGTFTLGQKPVSLAAIRANILTIGAQEDHIVPPASAAVLNRHVGSADRTVQILVGGHIGIVVGRHASQHLWPRLAAWLSARSRCRRAGG